jgi:hypothetical protein
MTRTLDRDLTEKKPYEEVIRYSDKLFRQVAVEWLVATNQVRILFLQLNHKLLPFLAAEPSPRSS